MSATRIVMTVLAGLIAVCVIALLTLAASAQQRQCGKEAAMLAAIFAEFGETIIWRGQADQGEVIMTYSDKDGSWTHLAVKGGIACIITGGFTSAFDRGI